MKKNTFPKSDRLKSRKKLQELFTKGRSVRVADLRLVYAVEQGSGILKCGVGVSGRSFKHAVDRNRIKRLLREGFRLQQHELKQIVANSEKDLFVFILYTGKILPNYTSVFQNVGLALQKLAGANAMGIKNS